MTKTNNEDLGVELHHTAKKIVEAGWVQKEPMPSVQAPEPNNHSDYIDTLDEIHEQSSAMLNMLMLNHRHAGNGQESLADSVLESYAWQLVENMKRAGTATQALSDSLRQESGHE
jgi:hypothetical protein